jgi:hypothetical protein
MIVFYCSKNKTRTKIVANLCIDNSILTENKQFLWGDYFTSTVMLNELEDKTGVPAVGELMYSRFRVVLPDPMAINRRVTMPPAEFGLGSAVYTAPPS